MHSGTRHLTASITALRPVPESADPRADARSDTHDIEAHASAATVPHRAIIPASVSELVGRQDDLDQLEQLMNHTRLVTITGPGGIGKSRLALAFAQVHQHDHADGAVYLTLDPPSSREALVVALGEAIDRGPHADAPEPRLTARLRERELLLVVDTSEQLGPDAIELLRELLRAAPGLRVLVTARARLGVKDEGVHDLHGLPWSPLPSRTDAMAAVAATPDAHAPTQAAPAGDPAPALRLFLLSARRAGVTLPPETWPDVGRICELVGGMPLAIELAAAWTRTLSCRDIANEIARSVDFLTCSWQDLPPRHRSLRAVFDHGLERLAPGERRLLHALAIFHGRISRVAAAQVAGATLAELAALVDKSFLRPHRAGGHELPRPLRQYLAEALTGADAEALHDRHNDYYTSWLAGRAPGADAHGARPSPSELAAELGNIDAAWTWAVEHGAWTRLDRCLDRLFGFYERQSRFRDGAERFVTTAERLGAVAGEAALRLRHRLEVRAAVLLGHLGRFREANDRLDACTGHFEAADDALEAALASACRAHVVLAGGGYERARRCLLAARDHLDAASAQPALGCSATLHQVIEAWVLRGLGHIAYVTGAYADARTWYERCLRHSRASEDVFREGMSASYLAAVAHRLGHMDEAERLNRSALATLRRTGAQRGLCRCLIQLGMVVCHTGRYAAALELFERALRIALDIGDQQHQAIAVGGSGVVYLHLGDPDSALPPLEASHDLLTRIGDRQYAGWSLAYLGLAHHRRGDHDRARALCESALRLCEATGDRTIEGHALNFLGHACLALGQVDDAARAYDRAVALFRDTRQRHLALEAAAGVARVAHARGTPEDAQPFVTEFLAHIQADADLDGVDEPCRVYATCCRHLSDAGDPRAELVRAAAEAMLDHHATEISDPEQRERFRGQFDAFSTLPKPSAGPGPAAAPEPDDEPGPASADDGFVLHEPLSKREREILTHVAAGLSNQEIASRCFISVNTVKRHISNIYGKLDVHSRTQAVARARRMRLMCEPTRR